jgi:hypothetical protein
VICEKKNVNLVFADVVPYAAAVDAVVVAETAVEVPSGYV